MISLLVKKFTRFLDALFTRKTCPSVSVEPALKSCNFISESSFEAEPEIASNINVLLRHVVRGDEEKVYEVLNLNPELILESASIVDRSSNYFYEITAFQYSFWSWDWHMCQLILSVCDDVGIIKQQLEDMHVNYSFRWHGKQFDWLPYFVSMDMYLTNNNIKKSAVMPVQCGVDSLDYYRLFLSYGDVSLEKSKLPINIVQELYRDFSEIYKAENISEKKRNSNFNLKESANTKMLLEYSVTKGYYYGPPQSKDFYFFGDVVKPPYPGYAKKEYEYMKKLYEVRVEQFSCLETLLLSDAMHCTYAPVKIN